MSAIWQPAPEATAVQEHAPAGHMRFTPVQSLAAVPTAVSAARRYARSELTRASLLGLIENGQLVTSELVTNAVIATGLMAADPKWSELEGLAVIRIRLGFGPASVLIEVWDRESVLPAQKEPGEDEEGGRGLLIVSVLCTRWGARPAAAGKVVWAELPMPAPTELPRRVPNRRYASAGPRGTNSPSNRAVDRAEEEVIAMSGDGGGGGTG